MCDRPHPGDRCTTSSSSRWPRIIAAELVLVRPGLKAETLGVARRASTVPMACIAMLIILVGIGRVFFGLKGWEYYVY